MPINTYTLTVLHVDCIIRKGLLIQNKQHFANIRPNINISNNQEEGYKEEEMKLFLVEQDAKMYYIIMHQSRQ